MSYTAAQVAAKYPECYKFTLGFEAGYVNDPRDPGGCTNMGITRATLEAWRGKTTTCADVKALTKDEAAEIYAEKYWKPTYGDVIPVGLNLQVWDFGVNAGVKRANRLLQKLVGVSQDGIIGPVTLKAVDTYVKLFGVNAAITSYHAMRQTYYESLSNFQYFGKGWTRRNNECKALGFELAETVAISTNDYEERISDLEARVSALEKVNAGKNVS